ncbi:bifunctional RNase H/acid phosphatase [Cumulibacter manganitolerans]|uniref:bifunctional RNase H/acid phosphatase n=1 Tax=Cumulibacter manganitolerans TaxID=1884992 RepID=UPI00188618DA|nr:bifunctional RNase H/acid phosphatase [Cumulibacter manganitolerans]
MSAPLRYVAMADGGSRGNPGIAGYGAVVVDTEADLVLAERAEYIGTASNNVAEYRGLIAALEAALELGITELEMRMDSKLVVEQMSGRWKIKHPAMKPLALRARALLDRFDRVDLQWIPRAENHLADRLANEAMDGAGKGDVNRVGGDPLADAGRGDDDPDPVQPAAATVTEGPPGSLVTMSPGPDPVLTLVMLRHGETEQSLERRFSGSSDLPLTGKGEAQAAAAAARIAGASAISAIYSSPLRRARQTAEAVGALIGVRVVVDDALREVDFGQWEGMTFTEARRAGGDAFTRWLADHELAPPGGESQQQCMERVAGLRNRLIRRHEGERVLIVTHMTPIKALIGEALGGLRIASRINLDLCSLSRVDYHDGRTVVKLVNEISHLGAL